MSSEEADHVSPREVTPTLGKGTLGTWRFLLRARARETVPGIQPTHQTRNKAVGKPCRRSVCEPALEPRRRWEGLWKKSQDFKPDQGKPAVRHYRGGHGKRSHGGTVNPSCNRKSSNGNPPPKAGRARALSQHFMNPGGAMMPPQRF